MQQIFSTTFLLFFYKAQFFSFFKKTTSSILVSPTFACQTLLDTHIIPKEKESWSASKKGGGMSRRTSCPCRAQKKGPGV
jgi:hypothetical protein